MKNTFTRLLGVGAVSLFALTIQLPAQTSAFTYQGALTQNGQPANGTYDFMFRLLNAPTDGAAAPVIPVNPGVGVTNGLFTTGIDFGAENFNGVNLWLEISVRTNGGGAFTTLAPRQLLTSAPYAVRAANLSGTVAASQLTGTIAPNNIGAASITSAMLANGAVGANQLAAGAVTTGALADGAVTAIKVATVTNWFALTIANPTPAGGESFGVSVAALGSDRLLIGGLNTEAAYVFGTNGTLLTTFFSPSSASHGRFGVSIAAVGGDFVLVGAVGDDTGASDAGAAYLFKTNGVLVTTFTNPAPVMLDFFGISVAEVGSDRVLIGAAGVDTGRRNAGAAYLFKTNGVLLATFNNPTPADDDWFGASVAAVGSDCILIGAQLDDTGAVNAGAAYLFSTNGALLATFTKPSPADYDNFGFSVAAVGSDRVLIGAPFDDTGAFGAGAAYMFNTNGTLVTTFANPNPEGEASFGNSVAAVGSDRVLVGAYLADTGASGAGAAYLFSTNGTLLNTFTNPTPAALDLFGSSVAAVGRDRVLIGAYEDDTVASATGAAYLFSVETFTGGLVAEAVRARGVTTANLEDGAITLAKLDPSIGVWTRSGDNVFRLPGNVGIGTNSPIERLVVAGNIYATGTITPNSDWNLKTAFEPVDAAAVLEKVSQLSIQQWRFKAEPEGVKHVGPMAQEFRAAFGLGAIPTAIATVDADGIALAAIQGLNQKLEDKLEQKQTEITELRQQNAELLKRLEAIEARLK